MEKNERKTGAILSYISIIINTLIQLIYTPFLIRMLGQSEYGLYSLVASIIGYLTVLDLGFGNAIIVYTAKYKAKHEPEKEAKMHGMFKIIFYIISIIIAIIGFILYFNIDRLFSNTMTNIELQKMKVMMLILIFNLIITFMFNIYTSIINAYEKFVYQKVLSIISSIIKPIIMIPLLFLGYKSITLCIVITIVNLIIVLSNYYYCKNKLKITVKYQGYDKNLFWEMLSYSIFIFLGVIADKVNWSVDQFILGLTSGTIAISIYSLASQLNSLFINLSTALSSVLLPKISKMVANNANSKELTNEMIKIGRIQYYIIFLMASSLVLFGKNFIIWWAGSEYQEAYTVALLLIIPLCIPLIQNLGLSILQAKNKHKFRAICMSIMSLINIGISYVLALKYGVIGAALGTTISLVLCNIIIMNIYYKKVIKLDILKFWQEIIKMSITFLIPLLSIIIFMNIIKINGIVGIIIYGLIYITIYILTVYFITSNAYEKQLIKKFLKIGK